MTELFRRCKEFQDSIWSGFTNIDEIKEYRYIPLDNSWTNLILFKGISGYRLAQITEYVEDKNETYYVVKFFDTKQTTLEYFDKWNFSTYFDKLFSVEIRKDKTKIIYSDGFHATAINYAISELENIVFNYLELHQGLDEEQLKNASEELENLKRNQNA